MSLKWEIQKQGIHRLCALADAMPFAVTFWDGATRQYGSGAPQFRLILRDPALLDRMQEDAEIGFGDAYMDGLIDVEGDIADFLVTASQTLARIVRAKDQTLRNLPVATGLMHRLQGASLPRFRRRSSQQQTQDVARHYNLSNDFFRLWLDDALVYSCAYFQSPQDTLEQAQQQKIQHSLRKLRLSPGETLLDIGCGWGGLVMQAAGCGAKALGITLSSEQLSGACDQIQAAGLEDRADVRLEHYRAQSGRQFDKIASIGMIEHVGKAHLAEFMQDVARLLRPGGVALLHMITSPIEGPFSPWLSKHIFPGAYLPTVAELTKLFEANRLYVQDAENLQTHYQYTLDHWSERFEAASPQVEAMFDDRFVRMWRLYLRSCSASFRVGTSTLHQFLVSNGPTTALPLTRNDLYV